MPSLTREAPAEVSMPVEVAVGEAAIIQTIIPLLPPLRLQIKALLRSAASTDGLHCLSGWR